MIILDLNVILDVVQRREPHYQAAAAILSQVVSAGLKACVPAHAVTTLYYIVAKHSTKQQADNLVDWLLQRCEIASTGKAEFLRARSLPLRDFEDAVVVIVSLMVIQTFVATGTLGAPHPTWERRTPVRHL